jgi:ring-1,2-phenylacetyl-CoA epoxidase subunit PaaC
MAMTATPAAPGTAARVEYLLRLADNPLVLGQRLAEWCGHGPALEEDLALTNIALDLIGQARLLLAHAGRVEGRGRDEDALAFLRDAGEFRNCTLLELPNAGPCAGPAAEGDYGMTIVRNLLFSAYQCLLWEALAQSADPELGAIAVKSSKEARYHLHHAGDWTIRLGDGTGESHERSQRALDELWPYAAEFFATDALERAMAEAGIGVDPATLEPAWRAQVEAVLAEATLQAPAPTRFRTAGKAGVHSEHLGYLLADLQFLQRAYPGATW